MKTTHQMTLLLAGLLLASQAMAAPVVIVNPKHSAKLSADDVKSIFLGRTNALPDGTTVQLALLKEGKVRDDFLTGALGKTESQFRSTWTQLLFTGKAQAPKQFDSEDDLKKFVSSTPGAVGFIDSGKLDGSVKKAD